jgi:hypothetical protein
LLVLMFCVGLEAVFKPLLSGGPKIARSRCHLPVSNVEWPKAFARFNAAAVRGLVNFRPWTGKLLFLNNVFPCTQFAVTTL